MIINTKILLFLSIGFLTINTEAQDAWTFVSSPDWHLAERELTPPVKPHEIELQLNTLKDMKKWNPELFLMAGDMVGGKWVGKEWITRFAEGGTQEEAIINIGKVAYGNLKQRFEENGFDKFVVTIGDHELGDDANWQPGNQYSYLLPVFRDAFQRVWNRDKNGDFLYSESIGSVESRPVGTPWENTSFAYKHKNVLFLSIDIYAQLAPDKPVGYLGHSVYADMPKEHLLWFENVLREAQKDPNIKHIIVQTHSPILAPVRGQRSSMLYCEHMEESTFFKVMERYGVDLYLAGEVHAPSAQRVRDKFPVQIVHGIAGINYLAIEVLDNKLNIMLQELHDKKFIQIGKIIIDKSRKKPTVIDSGVLKIINPEKPLIHYAFDKKELVSGNPPPGVGLTEQATSPVEHLEIPDISQMGRYYNLQTEAQLLDGVRGNALCLDGFKTAKCQGKGPITKNNPFTFIFWINTTQKGTSCIVSNGNGKNNFDIGLKEGRLTVFALNSYLQTYDNNKLINDGEWHQVAVVFPEKSKNLTELKLFVDGKKQKAQISGKNKMVMIKPSYNMLIGSSTSNKGSDIQNFVGCIDELSIWYNSLSNKMIKNEFKMTKEMK